MIGDLQKNARHKLSLRTHYEVVALMIISGGQTGVDRAALDAALAAGAPCGGWCPAARKAEDGVIPERYPLTEHKSASYAARTRQNVVDSDATLTISFGPPQGGTAKTVYFCRRQHKPHLVIDASTTSVDSALLRVTAFVRECKPQRLNVAGPRASAEPRAYDYAYALVSRLLEQDDSPLQRATRSQSPPSGLRSP
jgi:hypothetical protein